MRRLFSVALALLMVLSAISAQADPSAFPIVDEPIKVSIFVRQIDMQPDFADMYILQRYREMTGIEVEWINTPSAVLTEKLSVALASSELPDAFLKCSISSTNLQTYGDAGDFLDLAPLLSQFAPNFSAYMAQYPEVRASVTSPNGAIYSIPAATEAESTRINVKWFFNQKWLDALGLEQPTTLDGLYDVLLAFKTRDPNGNGEADEIPLSIDLSQLYMSFAGSFGLMNRGVHHEEYDIDPETGAVRHIKTSERWRELITFLHRLYAEGLLDEECITYTSAHAPALISQDRLGVFIGTNLTRLTTEQQTCFTPIKEAYEGPYGDKMWSAIRSHLHSVGAFVISSDSKYPEELLRWVDYFYSDEGMLLFNYGIVGDTCVQNEDGSYSYTDEILAMMNEGKSYDEVVSQYTPFSGGNNPSVMKYPYFAGQELTPGPMEAAANLYPYAPEIVWPFFTYTADENEIVTTAGSDINTFVRTTNAKFLTGELEVNDENWNAYVKTVQTMGLSEMLSVMEAAYARAQAIIDAE